MSEAVVPRVVCGLLPGSSELLLPELPGLCIFTGALGGSSSLWVGGALTWGTGGLGVMQCPWQFYITSPPTCPVSEKMQDCDLTRNPTGPRCLRVDKRQPEEWEELQGFSTQGWLSHCREDVKADGEPPPAPPPPPRPGNVVLDGFACGMFSGGRGARAEMLGSSLSLWQGSCSEEVEAGKKKLEKTSNK